MWTFVTFLTFGILAVGPAAGADEAEGPVSLELWNALGVVLPERWNARLRVMRPDGQAMFETPLVKENERISAQSLYLCRKEVKGWTCRSSGEEVHIEANGVFHRIRVEAYEAEGVVSGGRRGIRYETVGREILIRIVDYVYSSCFHAQQKGLGKEGVARWGDYKRPITFVGSIEGGAFVVGTSTGYSGRTFTIEADAAQKDCAFQLKRVGEWIV